MKSILFIIFSLIIITSCHHQVEDYNASSTYDAAKVDTLKIQRIKIKTH